MHRSNPKIGWNNFIDSLARLEVLIMPDQNNIPGLNEYYNANTVNVEVATGANTGFTVNTTTVSGSREQKAESPTCN